MSGDPPGADAGAGEPFFAPAVDLPPEVAEPRYVAPPWMRIPVEFVPVVWPRRELIGVTDDRLALVLTRFEIYPTGLWFGLSLTPEPGNERAAHAAAHPDLYADMAGYGASRLARRLRVGIAFGDGRTATNLFLHGPEFATEPPPALLRIAGGQGNVERVASEHWAWPLPGDGDLTLVVAWPSRGIPERRIVLPGDALRAAAAVSRAHEIWPGARVGPVTPPPPGY